MSSTYSTFLSERVASPTVRFTAPPRASTSLPERFSQGEFGCMSCSSSCCYFALWLPFCSTGAKGTVLYCCCSSSQLISITYITMHQHPVSNSCVSWLFGLASLMLFCNSTCPTVLLLCTHSAAAGSRNGAASLVKQINSYSTHALLLVCCRNNARSHKQSC